MPFSYYERLSRKQKRTYDKSDAIDRVALKDPAALLPLVAEVERCLATADQKATAKAVRAFVAAFVAATGAAPLRIRVMAARPSEDWGELHGLYEREDDAKPRVTVWMRTAKKKQVVKFRTFMRTVLHEVCHHLDYELFKLDDSFHTQGFYRRESSLMRELAPKEEPREEPQAGENLSLFW